MNTASLSFVTALLRNPTLSAQFHKYCGGSYPNPAFVFFVLFVVEQDLYSYHEGHEEHEG
jgi:hypothetical protein